MNVLKKTSATLQQLLDWFRQSFLRLRGKALEWLRQLGLLSKASENDFPEVEPQTELPEDYRQRFSLDMLPAPEQFKGRDKELGLIRKAREAGIPLLVSGPMGAGATSLLTMAAAGFEGAKFLADDSRIPTRKRLIQVLAEALGLEDVTTIEALIKQVPENQPVIIFENIERLFLRHIGGFDLLNDFLYILNQTSSSIVWIVSINSYSHYYLDRVLDLSSNFFYTVYLEPLPREILTEALFSRNEDCEAIFLKPDDMPRSLQRKLTKAGASEKKELLADHFFSSMYRFSNGNISRAVLFWVRSVVRVDEKRVYLKPFEHREKINPSLEERFVLEAILQHTSLSAADLSKVLDFPGRKSEVMIGKLQERFWVEARQRKNRTKEYQVNLLFLEELKSDLRIELNRKDHLHGKR